MTLVIQKHFNYLLCFESACVGGWRLIAKYEWHSSTDNSAKEGKEDIMEIKA